MNDSYRHKGLRQKLVLELREIGIKDEEVLAAINRVQRHLFLDPGFADWAYKDVAFPIGAGQTISQPSTVALQTVLLDVKKTDIVLEVGTGSGYQAAVLAEMGAKVYTIERQESLFRHTYELLIELGYGRIRTVYGDGYKGLPKFAPFDKIIVTAGATKIPHALLDQLKIGGIMVIPVGGSDTQEMLKITRDTKDHFIKERHGSCSFVPFLAGVQKV